MNDLIVPQTPGDLALFNDVMASSTTFPPRLQLFGAKSDACAEGKINIGRYGLVEDQEITDVGDALDCVILAFRGKAFNKSGEDVIVDYDPNSKIYNEIVTMAQKEGFGSGCMYGLELLLYLPDQDVFATFHFSSKSARRESKKVAPLIGKGMTLKCKLIEFKGYKWHNPVVLPCSNPMEVPDTYVKQVEQFKNPPVLEVATEDEGRTR
jgi:hypothetical protein